MSAERRGLLAVAIACCLVGAALLASSGAPAAAATGVVGTLVLIGVAVDGRRRTAIGAIVIAGAVAVVALAVRVLP